MNVHKFFGYPLVAGEYLLIIIPGVILGLYLGKILFKFIVLRAEMCCSIHQSLVLNREIKALLMKISDDSDQSRDQNRNKKPERACDASDFVDDRLRFHLKQNRSYFPVSHIIGDSENTFDGLDSVLTHVAMRYFDIYYAPFMKKNLKSDQRLCFNGPPYIITVVENFPVPMTDDEFERQA